MFASSVRSTPLPPPTVVPLPPSPVRPRSGLFGTASFNLFGRGAHADPLLPHLTWMQSNGATDENDVERLRDAFVRQVGPLWRSFHEASLITQVLLLRAASAFIDLDILKQIDSDLMEMMSRPADLPNDMADLRWLVRRHREDERLTQWIEGVAAFHGFERTVVLGAISHLHRHKGMIAFWRGDMPWLPFIDRTYWASVHFHGRRHCMAECAGVFSHFLAEKDARQAIAEPQVEHAVEGIRRAWRERLVYNRALGGWVRVEPDV